MLENKPHIGILTNFMGHDATFSLVNVVRTQLQMLISGGYDPVLFVADQFDGTGIWDGRLFEVHKVANYDADSDIVLEGLRAKTADIDVLLCHDLTFMSQYEKWGNALRSLTLERPSLALIHWQHSRGGHAPVDLIKNSWWAYPNNGDLEHVAKINNAPLDRVRYIPHPLDYEYLGWPDLAVRIAEDFDFPFKDISCVLPTRMDRGKQVEKALRLIAGLKRAGRSVCFIVADAYAQGKRFKDYKLELRKIAVGQGLTDKELVFLSEHYPECAQGAPHDVIKALYEMSNIFIQPSNAETSSLVALEAALAGNLLIMNADFPPILHLYKDALSLPFGSIFEDTKYYRTVRKADGSESKVEDKQLFWDERARDTVLPVLDQQFALQTKRQQLRDRWPSRVFKGFMEPLIMEVFEKQAGTEAVDVKAKGDLEVTAIITSLDNLPLLKKQVPILLAECGHVIVVSNGSKDGTNEWLEENADTPGLSFIIRENLGAGPGRNSGLDLWNNSTPYTLMVDGGILPPIGSVKLLKEFLERNPKIDVISPEVDSCFTTDEKEATRIVSDPLPDVSFPQRCISSTAYAMCRAKAWDGIRLSEEGPFGQPGWGVDDQDLQFRWNEAGIVHHDFTSKASGWKLFRRKSGSFQRLFDETGVWPNQYGSVYEQRNVLCAQLWLDHRQLCGMKRYPPISYVIYGVKMPEFAMLVKALHAKGKDNEIICKDDSDPEVKRWLDTFALRWEWGDVTFDPERKMLKRGKDYPEELWSGRVVRFREPVGQEVVEITPENLHEFLEEKQSEPA